MNPEKDMPKLHRYNQYLFAFLGTALLVLGVAGMLVAIVLVSRTNSKDSKTDMVLNEARENRGYQLKLSLDGINLLSQSRGLYVIPVGHVAAGVKLNQNRPSYGAYSSPLNNLMIYDSNTKQVHLIFDYKVSIKMYEIKKVNDDIYVLVLGANADTDANHKLDSGDLQKLFIYHVRSKALQTVQLKDTSFVSIERPYKKEEDKMDNGLTPVVFVSGGVDSNQNGSYDHKHEPETLYELNVQTSKLRELVPQSLFQEAEQIIQR